MSILQNLKKVHAAVVAQKMNNDESPFGVALNSAAVQAVLGGLGSEAWKNYMAVFADNAAQLERLTVKKAGEQPYVSQMRAYIASNGICDIGTNAHLNNGVDARIDGGHGGDPVIPDEPDDTTEPLRPAGLETIPEVTV